ncbi:MAG: hypothetical protein ACFB15_25815 [Cyclobacteriaceae bacterium]
MAGEHGTKELIEIKDSVIMLGVAAVKAMMDGFQPSDLLLFMDKKLIDSAQAAADNASVAVLEAKELDLEDSGDLFISSGKSMKYIHAELLTRKGEIIQPVEAYEAA